MSRGESKPRRSRDPFGNPRLFAWAVSQRKCYLKQMVRKIDLNSERAFENQKVSGDNPRQNQARFYWATELESKKFDNELSRRVSDKLVLEIGCSSGGLAESLAVHSSRYVGIDISDEGIKAATQKKIPRAEFVCTDGHSIPFPANSFDLVIASGVLHHLDLDTALPEISRVLRDDGLLAFDEPLGINPIFNLYRLLTPGSRTVDEKPFGPRELGEMNRFFKLSEVRFFGLFSIVSGFGKSSPLRAVLTNIDRAISRSPLKWLMWRFAGFAKVQAAIRPKGA